MKTPKQKASEWMNKFREAHEKHEKENEGKPMKFERPSVVCLPNQKQIAEELFNPKEDENKM